jgi:hypothetical protein
MVKKKNKYYVYDEDGKIIVVTSSRLIAEYYENGSNNT